MRKAKITVAIIALVVVSAFTYLAINSGVAAKNLDNTTKDLELKTIKLQSTEEKLKSVNLQVEKLKTQSSNDKAKQEQLEKEKKELEAKLQAKAEAKAKLELAAAETEKKITASNTAAAASVPIPSGSHQDWMAAAGISSNDYGYVDYIISRESGWNPNAVNASSGAEGLPQALPYSKTGCAHGDPVCQLKWASGYAIGRYGSWANAYNFWTSNHWW